MATKPLIVIVGPTGSGKSALAMMLAEAYGGEIICADSRTIYKGIDIATAKPSFEDQALIKHHGIDLVAPDHVFTVADFKQYTLRAIDEVSKRGNAPFLVGGTGLYIDAVLYDYNFRPVASERSRAEYADLSVEELQKRVLDRGLPLPNNPQNPRHLTRLLETGLESGSSSPLRKNTLIIGIDLSPEALRPRLEARVQTMLQAGLVEELRSVIERYDPELPALQMPAFSAFKDYLAGKGSLDEACALFVQKDLQLAKKQRTWFKRNKSIHWINDPRDAVDLVTTFLNK